MDDEREIERLRAENRTMAVALYRIAADAESWTKSASPRALARIARDALAKTSYDYERPTEDV